MRHVAVDCLFEQITRATACASNVGTFGGGVTHVGCLDGLPAGLRAAKFGPSWWPNCGEAQIRLKVLRPLRLQARSSGGV